MILINREIANMLTVEISPNNSVTATQYQFPDIPILRNRKCFGIIASLNSGVMTGNSNIFRDWISLGTGINPAFLNLKDANQKLFLQNLPVTELFATGLIAISEAVSANNRFAMTNTDGIFTFAPRVVQWSKSFVSMPTALGLANYCMQFNIIYL